MELTLRIANPAGNITIFVINPVPVEQMSSIASKLLDIPQYKAEQVAFNVPAQMGGAGRIQMMGGEFCGNALRSFGYLLSKLSPEHPSEVLTEISGSATPLLVEIDRQKSACKTQMPLPVKTSSLAFCGETYKMIVFDGIVHIIVPGVSQEEKFVRELIDFVRTSTLSDAYGVMFLENSQRLVPAVYVCNTDSLIWESSCGSGSMACAVYLSLHNPDGIYEYTLHQPGGVIDAAVEICSKKPVLCKMGGPVSLSEEIYLNLDLA